MDKNIIFTAQFPNLEESNFVEMKDKLLTSDHFSQGQYFPLEGSKVAAMGGSALHIFDNQTFTWTKIDKNLGYDLRWPIQIT